MSTSEVTRVTLFKIADPVAREKMLGMYKTMQSRALKDGKPYIVSCKAGHTEQDARNDGFTLVAVTTFADRAGFDFYDKECAAHGELKAYAATVREAFAMAFFTSVV